jgi:CheY-like chemotaxis protein
MFRFLVVEDNESTLRMLASLLSEEFEESAIDTAGNVAEGSQRLETSFKEGKTYDVALLDFSLPSISGGEEKIDHSLCEEFRSMNPRSLVIHMTAWDKEGAVLDHLAKSHSEPPGPWPVLVSKREVDWPVVLLRRLKTSLFSREIAMQMDEVFSHLPPAGGSGRAAALRRPTAREGGVTHRLAVLMQNIEQHWPDLSETLKERIRATFVVDTAGDEVRVSLL